MAGARLGLASDWRGIVIRRNHLSLWLGVGLALFIVCAAPALGQRYHVRTYTESDGMPSATVFDITQDLSGRMWFATRVGMVSFDGKDWVSHEVGSDYHGVRRPGVDKAYVIEDTEGVLWAASGVTSLNVFRYDGSAWRPLESQPPRHESRNWVTAFAALVRDGVSYLLAGTADGWLYSFDGQTWQVLPPARDRSGASIQAIEAVDDHFLVATDSGLQRFEPERNSRTTVPGLPTGEILGIGLAGHGVWLVGRDWIGRLAEDEFELLEQGLDFGLAPSWVMVAQDDGAGGLYFGNPSALLFFAPDSGLQRLGQSNGLIAAGATSLCLDREGNLWIGDLRGVTKLISRRFTSYSREHGLLMDEVSAILQRRSGQIVLGHPGGLTFWGPRPETVLLSSDEFRGRVLDLAEDEEGTLWVAASALGLIEMKPDGEQIIHLFGDPLKSAVNSVVHDRAGRLWVAETAGLHRRRGGSFEPFELPSSPDVMSPHFRRLVRGGDGSIWVLSNSGVYRVRGEAVEQWVGPLSSSRDVYAVLEHDDGDVWLGTRAGLYRLAGDAFAKVEAPGPVIDRPVYFIVRDEDGRVWFGTDNGVARWNGSELRWFTSQDGLIGAETNRAGGLVDTEGRVWIGMDRGVSVYDARQDARRTRGPEVVMTLVDAGGQCVSGDRTVNLDHRHNDVVFHFRAVAFVDEKRVRFRYRLEGLEDDWHGPELLPSREVRYTNLAPGSYRLRLQAIDVEGAWSNEAVSSTLKVRAAWWERAWFRILAAVGGLVLLAGIMSYVAQRRYARRLEEEIRLRTEALRASEAELSRTKRLKALGLLAGGVAHDFKNLLLVIQGYSKNLIEALDDDSALQKSAAEINRAGERASDLTRQLLAFSRKQALQPKRLNLNAAIGDMDEMLSRLTPENIEFVYHLAPVLGQVLVDSDQFDQVLINLVTNARDAMPEGGRLTIETSNVDLDEDPVSLPGMQPGPYVMLSVGDTGHGMDAETEARIFEPFFTTKELGRGSGLGLAMVYGIVKQSGGGIVVRSEPGVGTTFKVYLPRIEQVVD